MQRQNDFWFASFLIAVLMHACLLTVVSTKDAITKINCPFSSLHAGGEKKKFSDLEGSETSYYEVSEPSFESHKDIFSSYRPTIYYGTNSLPYFPSSSNFPNFPFIQNKTDNIHQQIKCGDTFSGVCQHSRYRSYDGSCNNLRNPTWGLANTRYGRLLRPRYSDGIRAPTSSITGGELPLARTVSFTLFPHAIIEDKIWTLVAMQYGQFMTHDLGLIDGTTQSKPHGTRCCTFDGQLASDWTTKSKCYPILIPYDDPVYSQTLIQCMNFVRSTTDLDRGCSSSYKPAEQLNTVTQYLDLSLVYGSNDEVAASLRAGFGGRLNVELKNNREFPPPASNKSTVCDTMYEFDVCYATGDSRGNQNPQLTVLQIILLREHNRVADYLSQLNPSWSDETIFQETRRIVIAEHQNIAYYEWLPIFLGRAQVYENKILYDTKDYVNDYDETVIANVLNEHANAAFRYFHSNIVGQLNLVPESRQYSPFASLRLSDHFNRPSIIEKGNNLDNLARGFAYQPQSKTDVFFDKEITQFLFRRGRPFGSDLRAIDIQRDRDHGLASYNDYREYCGLPRAKIFEDFLDVITASNVRKLSLLYVSADDVELTVGGSLERHVSGTLAGPTFLCIMLQQFQQTRIGDRYWFETGDPKIAFTLEQLNELRKSSISRLLCDNGDNIQNMQRYGFTQVSKMNPLRRCDDLPQVDLSLWKDYSLETQAHQSITPLFKKK